MALLDPAMSHLLRRAGFDDGIDDVLTVRQRVRFRMFERKMERRRLEMLQRARRQNANPQRRDRTQNR